MRVTLKLDGGFAHFPGLAKPIAVDTDGLAPDASRRLRELVNAAAFFQLPATVGGKTRGADVRKVTLTVEEGDRVHRVAGLETAIHGPLQKLVEFVEAHGSRA